MHIAILETGRINAEIADRFPRYPQMFRSLFGRQQDSGLVFSEVAVIDGEFPASVEDYDGYSSPARPPASMTIMTGSRR